MNYTSSSVIHNSSMKSNWIERPFEIKVVYNKDNGYQIVSLRFIW
jgi:hypothetical protein